MILICIINITTIITTITTNIIIIIIIIVIRAVRVEWRGLKPDCNLVRRSLSLRDCVHAHKQYRKTFSLWQKCFTGFYEYGALLGSPSDCRNSAVTQCVAWGLTLFGLQADVVDLVNMPQHKRVGADHVTIRPDSSIRVIWLTADHVNVRFIVVCSRIQNHMITPRAILLHVCKIISPWLISIDEVKQICSIRL